MRFFGRRSATPPRGIRQAMSALWWRERVRLGLPLGVAYLGLAQPTPSALELGAGISLAGVLLRGVTAGYLRKNRALATQGPYAYTRHPLYLGSMLIAAGLLVAGRSPVADAIGALYFWAFYTTAVQREEHKLKLRFGPSFDQYVEHVPRFLPHHLPHRLWPAGFSWRLYWRNGEYRAALGFGAAVVLLWLKMQWRG